MDAKALVTGVVEKLRAVREEKGISRYRLAKETGLSPSGLRHMEIGEVNPTLHSLFLIAQATGANLPRIIKAALDEEKAKGKGER